MNECQCECFFCLDNPKLGLDNPTLTRMVLCSVCGNKRCPKAFYHDNRCSGSNDLNQLSDCVNDEILDFLKWCEAPTDYYGDDLIWYILSKCNHAPLRQLEIPEKHKKAYTQISSLSDDDRYELVKNFVKSITCQWHIK